MIRNRALVLVSLTALVSVACVSEDVTVGPPPSSPTPLSELTLQECTADQAADGSAPAAGGDFTTIAPGILRVASHTAHPPFSDLQEGGATGFEVDLVTEVARRLDDLEVEIVSSPLEPMLEGLAAGQFDAAISALTITQDRRATVDFTEPYFSADQALTIRTTDAGTINGVHELEGRTVGVQAGTWGEECAGKGVEEQSGLSGVRAFDAVGEAFDGLAAGGIDAVLSDLATSRHFVDARPGFAVAQVVRTQEEYGIAVSKQNPDLRQAIDVALAQIREDGTYDQLFEEWFGTPPPA